MFLFQRETLVLRAYITDSLRLSRLWRHMFPSDAFWGKMVQLRVIVGRWPRLMLHGGLCMAALPGISVKILKPETVVFDSSVETLLDARPP